VRRQGVISLLVFAATFGLSSVAQAQYAFTKIMFPGSTWTEASGINDLGHIVGTYTDPTGIAHGFVYMNGSYTRMDFPGALHNYMFGIDNSGNMTGSYSLTLPRGPYHASYRANNGTWTDYDYPGHETDGRGISEAGDIVGIYNAGFGTADHGFLKVGEVYTAIDYPGASVTYVFGLNDLGQISGSYRDSNGVLKGFLYSGGTYTSISHPMGTETFIGGINDAGTMVGWKREGGKVGGFTTTNGRYRPVITPFANSANVKPRAINENGAVVGTYTAPDCTTGCSFLALPNGSTPICNQTVGMSYSTGTLNMAFTIGTTTSTTWTSYLIISGVAYRLWQLPIAAIQPAASVSVPLSLAPSGAVVLGSFLSTPSQGTICVDFALTNTLQVP
jgi:probable HAF family extracellular repeat protein